MEKKTIDEVGELAHFLYFSIRAVVHTRTEKTTCLIATSIYLGHNYGERCCVDARATFRDLELPTELDKGLVGLHIALVVVKRKKPHEAYGKVDLCTERRRHFESKSANVEPCAQPCG
jgi:hypothetical protein